jgi:UDP-2-acetamido-2,6-beta-L-arabino-hexul-4-ose reductase
MNRHPDSEIIYQTNVLLANQLTESLERTSHKPNLIFSSSSQEENENLYGKSKRLARNIFSNWATKNDAKFTGLVIPNVFGPFGKPYYNSVVATFCYQLTHLETPKIDVDIEMKLIFVGELVEEIIRIIDTNPNESKLIISHTKVITVSEILRLLSLYLNLYSLKGIIPQLNSRFELNLFNTFRSYEDIKSKFPVSLTSNLDQRGAFTEIIRLNVGGQVSFSTTHPGITRGNHYHTRKVERFAVIKGKALIQLRKVGTDEVLDFYISDEQPAYVDMPIWYTHNIKNIGETELYTMFWINEFYDPNDADTYLEVV